MERINAHEDLNVYQVSFAVAQQIFETSKEFPREEIYSLTDQIRRCSRSVCANIAEAYRKRRYKNAFIAKLSDAEEEAAETQVWLDFALNSGYISSFTHQELKKTYNQIIGKIIRMINTADKWTF